MPETSIEFRDELVRLKRIEGQVRGIQKMIISKRECVAVLTQLASAAAALKRVEENVLARHLKGCVISSLSAGDPDDRIRKVEEIVDILKSFRK